MHEVYNGIQKVNRLFATLAGWLVGCLSVVILIDVMFRYIFTRPLGWAVDFGELALLSIIYLPAALLSKEGGHVNVDVLIIHFAGRKRAVFDTFASLAGLFFSFLLAWQAVVTLGDVYQRGTVTMIGKLPVIPAVAFFVIGSIFLTLQEFINLLEGIARLMGRGQVGKSA